MVKCEKTMCIANICGQCGVTECKGEIRSLDKNYSDLTVAAQFYEQTKSAFDYFFSKKYVDEDTEE